MRVIENDKEMVKKIWLRLEKKYEGRYQLNRKGLRNSNLNVYN